MDTVITAIRTFDYGAWAQGLLDAASLQPLVCAVLGFVAIFAILARSLLGILAIVLFVPTILLQMQSGRAEHFFTICALIVLMVVYSIQRRRQVRTLTAIESEITQIHGDVDRFLRALDLRSKAADETRFDPSRQI